MTMLHALVTQVNGLDALMQEYFRKIDLMINSTGDEVRGMQAACS